MMRKTKGQSVLEYTVLISIVASALLMMSMYVRRSIYANLLLMQKQTNFEALR
jgi:hypothetical protein